MTHRTSKGRIVYDRPPHAWSTRDLERVVRHVEPARDPADVVRLLAVLLEAYVLFLRTLIGMWGYYSFWQVLPFVQEAIGKIWNTLVGNTEAPKSAAGRLKLDGGLSLL